MERSRLGTPLRHQYFEWRKGEGTGCPRTQQRTAAKARPRSSERESGGGRGRSGKARRHLGLMNTARAAGGTKHIRRSFNSPRSFSAKKRLNGAHSFCTSKMRRGGGCFSERRCRIPALSRGSNETFELRRNYQARRYAASTARISGTMKNVWGEIKGVRPPPAPPPYAPPPVWSCLQIISGWRAALITAVPPSCAACSPLSPLLARILFFTRRPSANEKRRPPRRASAFRHLFMLTGQLRGDMKMSAGLFKMQMCGNTFTAL